jgi:hypothetical protein
MGLVVLYLREAHPLAVVCGAVTFILDCSVYGHNNYFFTPGPHQVTTPEKAYDASRRHPAEGRHLLFRYPNSLLHGV